MTQQSSTSVAALGAAAPTITVPVASIASVGQASIAGDESMSLDQPSLLPEPGNVYVGEPTRCYYQCTLDLQPLSDLVNFGSKSWAVWACKRCHAASKALVRAVGQDSTLKKELSTLRRTNAELWKAKVRACRLDTDNVGVGVADLAGRQKVMREFITEVSTSVALREECPVEWLSHRRFIAWHKRVEGFSDEEAAARWLEMLNDSNVARRGEGDALMLAVAGVPRTVASRERRSSTVVHTSKPIGSVAEDVEARKALRVEGFEDVHHVQALSGVAGSLFRPGSVSNPTKTPLGKFPVPAEEPLLPALLPPTQPVVPSESLGSDGSARRALKRQASESAGPKRQALRFCSGVVKQLREEQLAHLETLKQQFGSRGTNPCTTLQMMANRRRDP
eukprot:2746424-Lingulodinium_polyedra.AAC.1